MPQVTTIVATTHAKPSTTESTAAPTTASTTTTVAPETDAHHRTGARNDRCRRPTPAIAGDPAPATTHKSQGASTTPPASATTPTTEESDSHNDSKTFHSIGGSITVREDHDKLIVVDITASPGYEGHQTDDFDHQVAVTFTSSNHKSEITVKLDHGRITHDTTEKGGSHEESGPPSTSDGGWRRRLGRPTDRPTIGLDLLKCRSVKTDWNPVLRAEFDKPYWNELQQFVAGERARHTVFPPAEQVFAALHLTPYEKTRVVLLGQDPYHGHGQAHGLCFSVRDGVDLPPSLVNIYAELRSDLGYRHADARQPRIVGPPGCAAAQHLPHRALPERQRRIRARAGRTSPTRCCARSTPSRTAWCSSCGGRMPARRRR